MKKKHNEGFSLVETLVAITVLALIVIPTCSGIIMAYRMNAKADELMQAQLAVSSAVETLMAEGIEKGTPNTEEDDDYGKTVDGDRFPEVLIAITKSADETYYTVKVTSVVDSDVFVDTSIRAVPQEPIQEGEETA